MASLRAALQFLLMTPAFIGRAFTPREIGEAVGFYPFVGRLLGEVSGISWDIRLRVSFLGISWQEVDGIRFMTNLRQVLDIRHLTTNPGWINFRGDISLRSSYP